MLTYFRACRTRCTGFLAGLARRCWSGVGRRGDVPVTWVQVAAALRPETVDLAAGGSARPGVVDRHAGAVRASGRR